LYDEGFTIAGARRHLRDQAMEGNGSNGGAEHPENGGEPAASLEGHASESVPRVASSDLAMLNRKTLLDLRDSLRSLLTALEDE
jgi:hypothetical protein